ncbi:beta-1,3-galactosyl-O-glycosyl-glycoprotein beta-1,6-N-acetylglucosaminyltransferase 7-like [Protopterus annectens]|uniref:beta-1,3-galactosyl-O-glycosyl-glycoprotein beta-1,6-N-acetylglucosaminyltransferase 7-like n=1 Tax=Protopterus annectens TaxID=7888 RepID=UPI001CF9EA65|nr:beta-1,3-galactosyl-O-glycosyl-glycoprotein beta-1,6-N-acetylglucosaminyltransferase 7-like [Protopterus annectens]
MAQLDSTKLGFLLCTGICTLIFIFLSLILPNGTNNLKQLTFTKTECGVYPDEICAALFEDNDAAIKLGEGCQKLYGTTLSDFEKPTNCSQLIEDLHIITSPLSEEEANYPLAYIITIHKEKEMFVKLLSAIYAPQNVYCIHTDNKSSEELKNIVRTLTACFGNVFIPTKTETVVYAGFSRLQADINCMKDLVQSETSWKHVINVCGQDYPLKTNKEIIQYIKSKWNGKNITPGIIQPKHFRYRTQFRYKENLGPKEYFVSRVPGEKTKAPHNLTIYFGTAYYVLFRPFVEFILKDTRALDLLEWSRDAYSPDEHYWVTLNRLEDAPGSTPNAEWEGSVRAIKWKDQEGILFDKCKGHYIRDICVYGSGDLKWIIQSQSLFANKFELSTYPLTIVCLERRYRIKVLQEAEVPIQPQWHLQKNVYFDMKLNSSKK